MFFHQPTNSDADVFNAFLYDGIDYGAHFHRGCEILIAMQGTQKAVVGGERYDLKAGEALFVAPYRIHSYERTEGSVTFVIVFSGAYVEEFGSRLSGKTPLDARFALSSETLRFVLSKFFGSGETKAATAFLHSVDCDRVKVPQPDGLTVRACLYAMIAEFDKTAAYAESDRDDEFVYSVIGYVERNFRSDISVATLAQELGYSYDYVSRLFAARFGIRFSELVNRYRAEEAARLIGTENVSATEAAMRSGFNSIRSFNRVYKELLGRTPTGR